MSEDNKTNLIVCVTIVAVVAIIGGLFTFYNSYFLILQQKAIEQGFFTLVVVCANIYES